MLSSRKDINTAIMILLQLWWPALGLHERACQDSNLNGEAADWALHLHEELLNTNTLRGMGAVILLGYATTGEPTRLQWILTNAGSLVNSVGYKTSQECGKGMCREKEVLTGLGRR